MTQVFTLANHKNPPVKRHRVELDRFDRGNATEVTDRATGGWCHSLLAVRKDLVGVEIDKVRSVPELFSPLVLSFRSPWERGIVFQPPAGGHLIDTRWRLRGE